MKRLIENKNIFMFESQTNVRTGFSLNVAETRRVLGIMSRSNSRIFTIRRQPVVLCLASTRVAAWRQNTVLKTMRFLKSTGWNPDMLQNKAAESLRGTFPSQCFQSDAHRHHNEGYYRPAALCWWRDFQPNVQRLLQHLFCFFQDNRSKYCAANRISWLSIRVRRGPFSIRFIWFTSWKHKSRPQRIPTVDQAASHSPDIHILVFQKKFTSNLLNCTSLSLWSQVVSKGCDVCWSVCWRPGGDTWRRVRPRWCPLLFVIFWSAEMMIILPHASLITHA